MIKRKEIFLIRRRVIMIKTKKIFWVRREDIMTKTGRQYYKKFKKKEKICHWMTVFPFLEEKLFGGPFIPVYPATEHVLEMG